MEDLYSSIGIQRPRGEERRYVVAGKHALSLVRYDAQNCPEMDGSTTLAEFIHPWTGRSHPEPEWAYVPPVQRLPLHMVVSCSNIDKSQAIDEDMWMVKLR